MQTEIYFPLQFPETKRTLRTFGKLKISKKNRASFLDQKNQPEVLVSQKFVKFVSFPENKTPFAYPLSVLGLQFPETKRTLRTFGKLKIRKKKSRQLFDQKNQPEVLVSQKFAKFVSFPEIDLRLHTLSVFWGCSFRKRNELCELLGN